MKTLNENKCSPRIVYAGDRDIGVWVLKFILENGVNPLALLISDDKRATHSNELLGLCGHLDSSQILKGDEFRTENGVALLKKLKPDYIICVHFPYIFPGNILKIPKYGVMNLHPAFLPYNRGWNTPTWAIYDDTPYGATLHFMNEQVDAGDIIHQKQIEISPKDTADSLYHRVKLLEFEVFKECWEDLIKYNYKTKKQEIEAGSIYKKGDIESIRLINLNEEIKAENLIKKLKALTTNNIKESAYFKTKDKVYRIQVHIEEDNNLKL